MSRIPFCKSCWTYYHLGKHLPCVVANPVHIEFRNDHGPQCTCFDCVMRRVARPVVLPVRPPSLVETWMATPLAKGKL